MDQNLSELQDLVATWHHHRLKQTKKMSRTNQFQDRSVHWDVSWTCQWPSWPFWVWPEAGEPHYFKKEMHHKTECKESVITGCLFHYKSIPTGSLFVEWSFSQPFEQCGKFLSLTRLDLIRSHFILSCCHVPDIHIYLTSLRPYTIVSCYAYCSSEAEFDIMGCSLFCHIVTSYRGGRGGWPLKCACVLFLFLLWGRGEDIKSEDIHTLKLLHVFLPWPWFQTTTQVSGRFK